VTAQVPGHSTPPTLNKTQCTDFQVLKQISITVKNLGSFQGLDLENAIKQF